MKLSLSQPLYCMTHGIISRPQFDAAQQALLLAIFDDDDSARAQAEEGLYPKTIENAEAEIRVRGFLLPWHELTSYALTLDLFPKRVGRHSMWSRAQIDAVIDALGEMRGGRNGEPRDIGGRLTPEAEARRRSKTPCDVWLRNERALYPRAKENLIKVRDATIGGFSLFPVWQAIGGDPGKVWPHRWGTHEISRAESKTKGELARYDNNMRRLTLGKVAEMDE